MGEASRENNVLLFLAVLERCLVAQGSQVELGAGVGAANHYYQK